MSVNKSMNKLLIHPLGTSLIPATIAYASDPAYHQSGAIGALGALAVGVTAAVAFKAAGILPGAMTNKFMQRTKENWFISTDDIKGCLWSLGKTAAGITAGVCTYQYIEPKVEKWVEDKNKIEMTAFQSNFNDEKTAFYPGATAPAFTL